MRVICAMVGACGKAETGQTNGLISISHNRSQNVGIILSKSVIPKDLNSRTSRFTNIGTQLRYLSTKTCVNLAFLHVGTLSC